MLQRGEESSYTILNGSEIAVSFLSCSPRLVALTELFTNFSQRFPGVIPKGINIDRVEDLPDEDWKFVMDVNLTGVMHSLRAEIREMNDKGSIVNASSIAGIAGFAKNAAYAAAKVCPNRSRV